MNMSKIITIKRPNEEELKKLNIDSWGIWEKESSEFPWIYDDKETFYVFKGEATVQLESGERINFGVGDLVTIEKGTKCTWTIRKDIRKAYKFG